jgi:hypothetical protein
MLKAIALALALCACGSKKDDAKKTDDTKKTEDKPAAKKSPADLFAGPKVSLPPPVAKLALEMPEADAKAAAPDVFAAKYGYKLPDYEGVEIATQIEAGRLYQIRVDLKQPVDTVKGWLAKSWGEPRAAKNSLGDPLYYFDSPDVGLRAVLEKSVSDSRLRYYKVMSVEQLLGTGDTFGFVKEPLLGMSQDEVMAAYAAFHPKVRDNDPGSILLNLPPITTSEHGNSVDARLKDGKVTGFTLSVSTGGDAAVDAAVAARFEQLFGKGKPDSTGLYTDYPGPPKAKAELRKDSASFSHTLWVADTKK